jgi:hypothetical protein
VPKLLREESRSRAVLKKDCGFRKLINARPPAKCPYICLELSQGANPLGFKLAGSIVNTTSGNDVSPGGELDFLTISISPPLMGCGIAFSKGL